MLIGGTVLLWWNEGRAVKTSDSIEGAASQTVVVNDLSTVDSSLNGKMICAPGMANTSDSIYDSQFGMGAVAIRIERDVEFYQWVEHSESKTENKIGGKQETTTTYTYSKEWTSNVVNSAEFKDPDYKGSNFVVANIEDARIQASNVTVGAYTLPQNMISSISNAQAMPVTITDEKTNELNKLVADALARNNQQVAIDSTKAQFVTVSGN